MVEKSIIGLLQEFSGILKMAGIDVKRIILYGSHARGTPREDSDIDVAVVSEEFGEDRVEEGMRLFRLAGRLDPRIEPVPVSLNALANDTWVPLLYELRKNGIDIPLH
jgi:predicted nucleotidyltransferase